MADRTRSARELWGDRLDRARESILAYLETSSSPARHSSDSERIAKSSSRAVCGQAVYNDLRMTSIDAATTLAFDAINELELDGLVLLYARDGDGLAMVRLHPAHEDS